MFPFRSTVEGYHKNEHSVDRITKHDSVIATNKLDCVPEAIFVWVGDEEGPGFAGVCGFVEAGEVSFAGGHDDGGAGVEGLDSAEV
jgi:hypothetical protein